MPDPALTSLLGQWKAAIQSATPGPWKASSYGPGALLSPTEADGEFIALARGAMPRLLEAVDRVLELHKSKVPWRILAEFGSDEAERYRYCATCSEHPSWPCPTVEALRDALSAQTPAEGSEDA